MSSVIRKLFLFCTCADCKAQNKIRKVTSKNKSGPRLDFYCRECGRKLNFKYGLVTHVRVKSSDLEYMVVTPEPATVPHVGLIAFMLEQTMLFEYSLTLLEGFYTAKGEPCLQVGSPLGLVVLDPTDLRVPGTQILKNHRRLVTKLLLGLGHQSVLELSGVPSEKHIVVKLFRQALNEAGLISMSTIIPDVVGNLLVKHKN